MNKILEIFSPFFSHILPPRCPISGDIVSHQGMVSPKSWQALNFIAPPFCDCCGLPLEVAVEDSGALLCGACTARKKSFHKARSALTYDDASRSLILSFKHGDKTHVALSFSPWLRAAGADMLKDADLIVPVPLHWLRLLKRRYNQSGLIAGRLSKDTGTEYIPDLLKRIRHTPVQGHLSSKKRYENVRHAFDVNPKFAEKLKRKNIVLIDDVYTTGATIEECAEILYAAGAARVDVLTVARVAKPDAMS